MIQYNIYAGLGGSFGGATYQYTSNFENRDAAENEAWERACEIYESCEGMHGLLDYQYFIKDYCEENEIDEDSLTKEDYEDIDISYNEERIMD